ncbi:hypothetical protein [Levilactobacillus suantsaiihabitans]|uniref:Uncharacterized protein n=1 Tax=Levilactobacillus suantsaiihabitans TaxID=2487722 RepID=A0A4Z0J7F0_9LACO|nr:hypothetical protein [Levilactobacillus suantsaiihabitans]TGD18546.1 hypothetical protein EGT51_07795 [Levilactobacillus suantsaiihabitans]
MTFGLKVDDKDKSATEGSGQSDDIGLIRCLNQLAPTSGGAIQMAPLRANPTFDERQAASQRQCLR